MNEITPNEALLILLVQQDGIDATNVVEKMRTAQSRLVDRILPNTSDRGHRSWLNQRQQVEDIDSYIARATRGNASLFS